MFGTNKVLIAHCTHCSKEIMGLQGKGVNHFTRVSFNGYRLGKTSKKKINWFCSDRCAYHYAKFIEVPASIPPRSKCASKLFTSKLDRLLEMEDKRSMALGNSIIRR